MADIQAQGERLLGTVRENQVSAAEKPVTAPDHGVAKHARKTRARLKLKALPTYAQSKHKVAGVSDIEAHSKRLFSALSTESNYRYFAVERLKPMSVNRSASTVAAYLSRSLEMDNLTSRQKAAIRRVDRKFYEVKHFIYEDRRLDRKDRAQLLSILSFERMKARESIKQPANNTEGFSMEASRSIRALWDEDKFPSFSISGPGRQYEGPSGEISGPEQPEEARPEQPEGTKPQGAKGRIRSIMDILSRRVTPQQLANKAKELDEADLYAKKARFSANVHYIDKKTDKTVFIDTGKHIALRRTGMTEAGVALALKMAKDRFGSTLTINGTAEFKSLIIEAAAKNGMDIHFTDKAMNRALEERKAELEIEREAEKIEPAPLSPAGAEAAKTDQVTPWASTATTAVPVSSQSESSETPVDAAKFVASAPTKPNMMSLKFNSAVLDANDPAALKAAVVDLNAKLEEFPKALEGARLYLSETQEQLKVESEPIAKAELTMTEARFKGTIAMLEHDIALLNDDLTRLAGNLKLLEGREVVSPMVEDFPLVEQLSGGTVNDPSAIASAVTEIDKKLQGYTGYKQDAENYRAELRNELAGDIPPATRDILTSQLEHKTYQVGMYNAYIDYLSKERDDLVSRLTPEGAKAQQINVAPSDVDSIASAIKDIDKQLEVFGSSKQQANNYRAELRKELGGDKSAESNGALRSQLEHKAYQVGEIDAFIDYLNAERGKLVGRAKALGIAEVFPPSVEKTPPVQQAAVAQAAPKQPVNEASALKPTVQGVLIDHGTAPYKHEPNNNPSYYVSVKTHEGVKTLWGVGLKDAMAEQKLKPGDRISLTELSGDPVSVTRQQADGSVAAVETVRKGWAVSSLDEPRREEQSFLAGEFAKTLERTGMSRSEFLAEPKETAKLAEYHAVNMSVGNDVTNEGKELVFELMRDPVYRQKFAVEVDRHFINLPDDLKAETQRFVGEAFDLVSEGERVYGGTSPDVETSVLGVSDTLTQQVVAEEVDDGYEYDYESVRG